MSSRQTSVLTYRSIRDSGTLSKMRWRVYAWLYHHGPLTGRELDATLAVRGETRTSYHKRLSELRNMGLICEVRERKCSITGQNAIEWDTTNAMVPESLAKPIGYRDLVKNLLKLVAEHPDSIPCQEIQKLLNRKCFQKAKKPKNQLNLLER